ncbi:hypothetical protein BDP27DRAFT_1422906 [Rhodocollybia butyracea]|uniref:Uncharacterized protein n=1 Tax=Rhodocollybia butyracea TaxID=206335 RepID=A0A9P5U6Z5_9AGAR|nr:hypothetical protein BDP27DRAFT_1422906 [Rhodocollybia butyracea]
MSHLTHIIAVYSGSIVSQQVINPNIVDFSIVPIYNKLDTESESSEAPEDNHNSDFASTQSTRVAASADIAKSIPILSVPFNHNDETDPWETPVPTLLDNAPIDIGVAENPIDIDNPPQSSLALRTSYLTRTIFWTTAPWGSLEDNIRILPTLLNRLLPNTTPGDSFEHPIELGETGDSIVDPINVDKEEGPSVPASPVLLQPPTKEE